MSKKSNREKELGNTNKIRNFKGRITTGSEDVLINELNFFF